MIPYACNLIDLMRSPLVGKKWLSVTIRWCLVLWKMSYTTLLIRILSNNSGRFLKSNLDQVKSCQMTYIHMYKNIYIYILYPTIPYHMLHGGICTFSGSCCCHYSCPGPPQCARPFTGGGGATDKAWGVGVSGKLSGGDCWMKYPQKF